MNILLTCAGRRNYLVRYFQEALGGRGEVYAADSSTEAASLQEADKGFIVPAITHANYCDNIIAICQKYQVRLLISLNDLELSLLARQRERFLDAGTIPIISSPEVIDICFDKWLSLQFLKDNNLRLPKTYLSLAEAQQGLSEGNLVFPLVVKPRWGTASIGIEYPEDDEELELAYRLVKRRIGKTILADASATDFERSILIQERLHGQEYGMDVINDLDGHYVTTFVKRKLVMRAGETDRAITVKNEQLEHLGRVIGQKLKHVGNLDCDVFMNEEGCYVLEMNPRFGGGYPFSHTAGANLPAMLIAWVNHETPDPRWLVANPGVAASKCDRVVVVKKEGLFQPTDLA